MTKTIGGGARAIIYKVIMPCMEEFRAGKLLTRLDDVYKRTADITGKSESTVLRIVLEGKASIVLKPIEESIPGVECLEQVADVIEQYKKKDNPVAGVIVEPIQSEGGDHEGSPEFFQKLQQICKKSGAALIIDEVQTGCGPTGKMWCYEHFNLPTPPDVLTFSKKMLTGGFYFNADFKPPHAYRVFNTWMGDPGKLILLETVLKVIKQENLLRSVNETGNFLKDGLHQLEAEFPNVMNSVRGRGTFLAYNMPTTELRDRINDNLKKKGILGGVCGDNAIRLRPSLVFQRNHAEIYLDALRKTLKEL